MAGAHSRDQPVGRPVSGQHLERLALGQPAATLWRECRAALRAAFDALPGGPREWRFGGDTILAARWGHRTSFDIDLTVGPGIDVDALLEPEGNAIQALAARLGGIRESGGAPTLLWEGPGPRPGSAGR